MQNPLAPRSDAVYALFRSFAGALFFFHGTQKLFGFPGGNPPRELLSLAGLAGVIETVGGALIAIGLFAAPSAFICSGTMAVAYFLRHAGDAFLPIVNRGELAVLYCFVFLYIAATGSGKYSIESMLHMANRKRRRANGA